MRIRSLILILTLLMLHSQSIACRMLGVIALPGQELGYVDHPDELNLALMDELETFRLQGGSGPWPYSNEDGWGMTSYVINQQSPGAITTRSAVEAYADEGFYDSTHFLLNRPDVNILLGHLRQTSSGANNVENPHPFVFESPSGQVFSFAHNGDLDKTVLRELIGDEWLSLHPPNTHGHGAWNDEGWSYIVDSELFFFWIMKSIELHDDVETGLIEALVTLENRLPHQVKNFLFSDGFNLMAYRSSSTADIHYLDNPGSDLYLNSPWAESNHRVIMSSPPETGTLSEIDWIELSDRSLLIFRANGETQLENIAFRMEQDEVPETPQRIVPTSSAYPNPFNGEVTIQAKVPLSGEYVLRIFDARGRLASAPVSKEVGKGVLTYQWSDRSTTGVPVNSGTYIYLIDGPEIQLRGKLLLLK